MTTHQNITRAVEMLCECFRSGGKLLVCGNGGSAADSAHIVGELVKGFLKKRPLPADWSFALDEAPLQMGLPAIDLTAQGAVISAITNDQGGDLIFAQQVMAYGVPGDILLGISTSGNSANVITAMHAAKVKGMRCIALTGGSGGKMLDLADLAIIAPEKETHLVQEYHIRYYHEICARVEAEFYPV